MTKITEKEHIMAQDAQEEQVPVSSVSPSDPEPEPTPDPEEPTKPDELGLVLPDDAAPVEKVTSADQLLGFDADGNPITATAQQLKDYATEGLASTEALNKALAGKLDKTGGTLTNGIEIDRDLGITASFGVDTGGAYMLVSVDGKQAGILYLNANGLTYTDAEGRRNAIWHSGNFDAATALHWLGRGALLDEWNIGHGFTEGDTPIGGSSSFLCFGLSGYRIEIALGGYSSWQDGWNRIFFRSQDGDSGKVSDWKEFYHSGNLTPATAASVGLMSAADKIKLNAVASAMSLPADEPATMALNQEESVSSEISIRAQRSARYQMQTDELLYDALEAFARNHPEYTEFAEWIAAKDRIRAELAKPETLNPE